MLSSKTNGKMTPKKVTNSGIKIQKLAIFCHLLIVIPMQSKKNSQMDILLRELPRSPSTSPFVSRKMNVCNSNCSEETETHENWNDRKWNCRFFERSSRYFLLRIKNIASASDPVTPRAEIPVSPRKRHNEKSKSTKQDLDEFVTYGVSEWFKDGCFSQNPIKSFEWCFVIPG